MGEDGQDFGFIFLWFVGDLMSWQMKQVGKVCLWEFWGLWW